MKPAETNSNTPNKEKRGWTLWALVFALAAPALAQNATAPMDPARRNHPKREVVVSIPDRKLAVLENGEVIRTFPVAVGASVSPSPAGDFQIVNRVAHPTYYHPGTVIPPGADNPIGPRWLGLNRKGFGIHGTNEPQSIGKAASHGCIRLRNRDVEQFFTMVRVGDTVHIRAERDEQIAQIFGGPVVTSIVAEVQTAGSSQAGGGQ
jgi:lipoprotein-anchoring transpeptidase ErfK/SrfK